MNLRGPWLILVLVATVGCSRAGTESDPTLAQLAVRRTPVEVTAAVRTELRSTLELVGSLLPRRRTIIVAEVDGVIRSIPVPEKDPVTITFRERTTSLPLDIGSEVAKGELLVQLDPADYERSLNVAEAQLAKTKADMANLLAWQRPEEVRQLRALHDEALANSNRAQAQFQRVQKLKQNEAISDKEFEQSESDAIRARAMLAHAQAKLEVAEAGPTAEEIEVGRAAIAAAEADVREKRWKVEKTSVYAPYDAVVTDRFVDIGDRVTALPRVEIMELMDVSFLAAEVGVPEHYGDKIHELDRAVVRLKSSREDIPGLIVRVNDKVDPASRTFRVRVAIENEERRYRVGQFARVLLNVATSSSSLAVPQRAITYAGGQPSVFVFSDGVVHQRQVELGIATDVAVEIVAGLEEGEQVVIDDPAILTDGMNVERTTERQARVSPRARPR